jgi:hypothetical protein
MSGIDISADYEARIRRSIAERTKEKRKRQVEKNECSDIDLMESDHQFAFIAGYTSGGTAYGITWEEWGNDDINDSEENIFL